MSDRLQRFLNLQQRPQRVRLSPARELVPRPRRRQFNNRRLTLGGPLWRPSPEPHLARYSPPTRSGVGVRRLRRWRAS